jgi:hypothetical protein
MAMQRARSCTTYLLLCRALPTAAAACMGMCPPAWSPPAHATFIKWGAGCTIQQLETYQKHGCCAREEPREWNKKHASLGWVRQRGHFVVG